eukprot:3243744-Rhodomonas_salina.1
MNIQGSKPAKGTHRHKEGFHVWVSLKIKAAQSNVSTNDRQARSKPRRRTGHTCVTSQHRQVSRRSEE